MENERFEKPASAMHPCYSQSDLTLAKRNVKCRAINRPIHDQKRSLYAVFDLGA